MYYLVYGLLYLISLLPFRVLYIISDAFYGLLYHVMGYRKKVVMNNLLIAFPAMSEEERKAIARKFYHNLVDYFFESIKLISISDKQFNKRCSGNFDEINRVAATGTSIQVHSGHQFNLELAIRIYSQKLSIPFVVVYMPISNKPLDRIFRKVRLKYGSVLINATKYRRDMLGIYKKQHALALAADQSPGVPTAGFWLNFFGKPVPFLYAPEKRAQRSNVPVVFSNFKKIKRGYYSFENTIVTHTPAELPKGALTKMYRDFLEQQILEQPDNYLWSHRRWKNEFKEEYRKLWIDD